MELNNYEINYNCRVIIKPNNENNLQKINSEILVKDDGLFIIIGLVNS